MHTLYPTPFQFPTSSSRTDSHTPSTPEPRYDPLAIVRQAELAEQKAALLAASTNYCTDVPRSSTVAPGVLSDGSLTIAHPEIRHFMTSAQSNPRTPPPTSPTMYALAALAVFYHPKRSAHWIFWSKERRGDTANIVQKVLGRFATRSAFSSSYFFNLK